MTSAQAGKPAAFALTFLAPPELESDLGELDALEPGPAGSGGDYRGVTGPGGSSVASDPGVSHSGEVNWLPKARAAAGRMGVTDEQVSQALSLPDDAAPDQRDPRCMVFRRGKLTVVTGRDGRVIAVRRR